ncbi:MAG TPA: alpha/beta hydrolase, partial [Pirellula sp.]|nr:alpha/beta hydrolase [Pirellula sp.]
KSIGAKFVAHLNETGNELDGRFLTGSVPLPLVMKLQTNDLPLANTVKDEKEVPLDSTTVTPNTTKVLEKSSPLLLENEKPATPKRTDMVSSTFLEETPFEVTFGGTKSKKGKEPAVVENAIKLSGTLTIPKSNNGSQPRKFPAVIMISGSGPQDRDETIGRHKPFQTIAHYLAENGIASLRYDDRGVGESTGNYLNATSEVFAKDALEVWSHATTISELDKTRIGILGHSEGGLIGPMAAVWEPKVAFLILIAPPGITGSEILKTQIDRISELQGMNETDRKATIALQGKLQDIASGYITDEANMRRDIQNAIRQNWDSLKSIAKSQNPNANLDQIRKDLTLQIEEQFQQLCMPWFQFFLSYDPTPNWMMVRCPTLALWGSNDVQVLPEINRAKIAKAIERNQKLAADLEILPGLNHLLQTSKSGLPEEYDEIGESISLKALSRIRIWAEGQGLMER